MKILIFGATGGTGTELVKQALERGHLVTAFVRNPAQLVDKGEGLTLVTGDIHDVASVAFRGRTQCSAPWARET